MNRKELLFNLLEKLESGEIRLSISSSGELFLSDGQNQIKILEITKWTALNDEKNRKTSLELDTLSDFVSWNKEFKKNYE